MIVGIRKAIDRSDPSQTTKIELLVAHIERLEQHVARLEKWAACGHDSLRADSIGTAVLVCADCGAEFAELGRRPLPLIKGIEL